MEKLQETSAIGWTHTTAWTIVWISALAACPLLPALWKDRSARSTCVECMVLDPNQAPREALATLPGIGRTFADRIARERDREPYTSLESLADRVQGIGPARREELRPFLRFETRRETSRPIGNE